MALFLPNGYKLIRKFGKFKARKTFLTLIEYSQTISSQFFGRSQIDFTRNLPAQKVTLHSLHESRSCNFLFRPKFFSLCELRHLLQLLHDPEHDLLVESAAHDLHGQREADAANHGRFQDGVDLREKVLQYG